MSKRDEIKRKREILEVLLNSKQVKKEKVVKMESKKEDLDLAPKSVEKKKKKIVKKRNK